MKLFVFLLSLLLFGSPDARAESILVVGHNTNSECAYMDQEIGGIWEYRGGRLYKGGQSWPVVDDAAEMVWTPLGIRAVITARLGKSPRLSFTTSWGCRWSSP